MHARDGALVSSTFQRIRHVRSHHWPRNFLFTFYQDQRNPAKTRPTRTSLHAKFPRRTSQKKGILVSSITYSTRSREIDPPRRSVSRRCHSERACSSVYELGKPIKFVIPPAAVLLPRCLQAAVILADKGTVSLCVSRNLPVSKLPYQDWVSGFNFRL